MGISANHTASQVVFREQLTLDYPLLSAFDASEVITKYAGWLDKEKRLSNRAYVVIDKKGIVRYAKVMENPGEVLPLKDIEQELSNLD